MLTLTCQCCGFSRIFQDADEAYRAGWDCPPLFTGYVACDLCPAVCVVLGMSHKLAHAHWTANGRPKTFNFDNCLPDAHWTEEKN